MARTVEQMIDSISHELHLAAKSRKPSIMREHIRKADYVLFDLDETLRGASPIGFDIMAEESDYDDEEDEDE